MKGIFIALFVSLSFSLLSQNNSDKIIGYYLNVDPFSDAVSQVKIYKASDNVYHGVVEWTQDADRKQFEGFVFLTGLAYNSEKNEWENGECVYPGKKGKYKLNATIEKDGNLKVRGYWGVSLLGKTIYWTREASSRK